MGRQGHPTPSPLRPLRHSIGAMADSGGGSKLELGLPRTDNVLLTSILALKFLQAFGYYGISIILTTFLTTELGMTDRAAGGLYGIYGMLISVMSLVTAPVIDRLGIRCSFLVGAVLITFSRAVLASSTSSTVATVVLCTTLPTGEAFGLPVLSHAVGVVSSDADRKWAYGLYYTAMNVAVIAIGPLIDYLRLAEDLALAFDTTPYRFLGYVCAAAGAVSFGVAWVMLKPLDVGKCRVTAAAKEDESILGNVSVLGDRRFRKYISLVGVLVGVRMMFRHLDATFPKYIVRAFGEAAPYGKLYAINPAIIITLVPIIASIDVRPIQAQDKTADGLASQPSAIGKMLRKIPLLMWLAKLRPIDSILLGTSISTASVCWVVFDTSISSSAMFVVTLSVGEALWSPRFYDYTFEVAPPGKTGLYFALANVPLFLPKVLAGFMSGYLLEQYCTAEDCADPRPLWGWIMAACIPFPVVLYLFKSWINLIQPRGQVQPFEL